MNWECKWVEGKGEGREREYMKREVNMLERYMCWYCIIMDINFRKVPYMEEKMNQKHYIIILKSNSGYNQMI